MGLSRGHIMAEVESSLRRLQLDYIDLYQVHAWDFETPIEETMRALDDLVHMGKVRYLGASNFTAWQLMKSLWVSDRRAHAVRLAAAAVQPHLPRHRARAAPGVPLRRRRRHPMESARRRLPHRQVSSGRKAARGRAADEAGHLASANQRAKLPNAGGGRADREGARPVGLASRARVVQSTARHRPLPSFMARGPRRKTTTTSARSGSSWTRPTGGAGQGERAADRE